MSIKGMNAEPPIARFQLEHQPQRPGYAKRSVTKMSDALCQLATTTVAGFADTIGYCSRNGTPWAPCSGARQSTLVFLARRFCPLQTP